MRTVTDPFSPITIRGMVVPNRFMRSATHDGSADRSGAVTQKSLSIYRALGEGEIGLIVSGFAFVSETGQALPGQYGAHSDRMIPGLKRMAAAVHSGGGRIALQIVHAGAASPHLMSRGIPGPAPSRIEGRSMVHREMTSDEIEAGIRDFGAAAARAREAGFDAVGFLCLRRRGIYFALLTMAFAQMLYFTANIWESLTGGEPGLRNIPHPPLEIPGLFSLNIYTPLRFYYFVFAFVALSLLILNRILESPFGKVLQGIRENEKRARAAGYHTGRVKWLSFILSGTFPDWPEPSTPSTSILSAWSSSTGRLRGRSCS